MTTQENIAMTWCVLDEGLKYVCKVKSLTVEVQYFLAIGTWGWTISSKNYYAASENGYPTDKSAKRRALQIAKKLA